MSIKRLDYGLFQNPFQDDRFSENDCGPRKWVMQRTFWGWGWRAGNFCLSTLQFVFVFLVFLTTFSLYFYFWWFIFLTTSPCRSATALMEVERATPPGFEEEILKPPEVNNITIMIIFITILTVIIFTIFTNILMRNGEHHHHHATQDRWSLNYSRAKKSYFVWTNCIVHLI